MANSYLGEREIKLNGKSYTLAYPWRAIAEARASIGVEGIAKFNNLQEIEPLVLAKMVAIGLKKHHPDEANEDFVLDASPVFAEVIKAIDDALSYSYFGPEFVEAREKAQALAKEEKEDFKKKIS